VLVDQQVSLIKELDNHVMKCVKDQNGNHVIQKAIECVAHEHIQFIFDAFSGQVGQLAIHSYGCRVIQRILERGSPPLKQSIIRELHQCGSTLVSDQFGNYVTQGVISLGSDKDKETIINLVKANLMAFSRHKYASNVVEKCLTEGTDEQKHEMMKKVLERTDNRDSNLISMIKDQYANYVLRM
jgi:mRNA-binding protein PUF3